MGMSLIRWTILLFTCISFVSTFDADTQTDRNNGAKIAAAGLIALAILAVWGV